MQLSCSDIMPGLGCAFVAVSSTPANLHGAVVTHISLAHGELADDVSEQGLEEFREEIDLRVLEMVSALN